MNELVLPFKPFTLGEVQAITGIPSQVLDALVHDEVLPLHLGDDKFTRGLNDTQTFAVFCCAKFLKEGSDLTRAVEVLKLVVGTGIIQCKKMSLQSRTMMPCIVPSEMGPQGMWVDAILEKRLGRALCLPALIGEFESQLQRVFTN